MSPSAGRADTAGPREIPRRLDSLTGLRFLAALVVFAFHLASFLYWRSASLRGLSRLYVQGPVGVSFFFILSGFVLTWSHRPGDPAAGFIRRRLARIGPLHVVTWALMIPVTLGLGYQLSQGATVVSLALFSPWAPAWSAHLVLNTPSWSLGCELFFYMLFPVVYEGLVRLSIAARRTVAVVCVAAIPALAAALSPATSPVGHWLIYFFPPTRLLEFVLGMVLALELAAGRLPRVWLPAAATLAGIGYLAAGWAPTAYSPVAVTVVPFALLILAAAQADAGARPSALRLRPVVALGEWSFALYMIHWTVLSLLVRLPLGNRLGGTATVLITLACMAVTIAAAALLHAVVERPLESRLRGRRVDALTTTASVG